MFPACFGNANALERSPVTTQAKLLNWAEAALMLQMTLRRALTPLLPNLDAQLVPYSRTRAGQSAHLPHTAPSASSMPSAPASPCEQGQTPADGSSTAHVQDQSDRQPARFIHPPLISEFSLSSVNHAQGLQGTSTQALQTGLSPACSWQDNASKGYQPHVQQAEESEVKARHSRVSISTLGSIKKSVFTVAQHQPTVVHSEALQPDQMPRDGHVTGTLSPTASASASAYQEQEELLLSQAADLHPASHYSHSGQAAQLERPLHEGNVLQDITGTELHQNSANVHVFQDRVSGRSSLSPGTAQNRALPNTPTVITAHGRAILNSPDRQGKALLGPAALRTTGDAQPVVQSAEAIQEAAVLDAVQQVHQAQGEAVVPALQALQLQIATAGDAVLQGCLPQVCACINCSVLPHLICQHGTSISKPLSVSNAKTPLVCEHLQLFTINVFVDACMQFFNHHCLHSFVDVPVYCSGHIINSSCACRWYQRCFHC